MRPSGDGDREMSRKVSEILVGDRKALLLDFGGDAGILGFDRRLGRRVRAELVGVESGPALSSEASEGRCRRDVDRVNGPKYPSRASDLSEREGDGGMTRGVAGTVLGEEGIWDDRTANCGSAEVQRRPTSGLVQVSVLSQARLPQNIGGLPND